MQKKRMKKKRKHHLNANANRVENKPSQSQVSAKALTDAC